MTWRDDLAALAQSVTAIEASLEAERTARLAAENAITAERAARLAAEKAFADHMASVHPPVPPPPTITVSFSAPAEGATLTGAYSDSPSIEVIGTNIVKVEFLVDNALVNTENVAPWRAVLDTRKYADGTHTLKAVAYNSAGATAIATRSVIFKNAVAPTPPPPTPTPAATIAAECATEADVKKHPDILWYGSFDDWARASADWNIPPYNEQQQMDIYGPATPANPGPRFQFINVPEFSGSGNRGVRWVSAGIAEGTIPANGNGSTIMNWKKYINATSLNRQRSIGWAYPGGSALGTVREKDLYARFAIYIEPSWRVGFNEIAIKLPNLSRFLNGATPGFCGGPMWADRHDINGVKRFFANTYWWGMKPGGGTYQSGGYGGQVLTVPNTFELLPGRWHSYEIHMKINDFDGTTPVPNAAMEFWFDDALCYSAKNFVLTNVVGNNDPISTTVDEIAFFWGELFHGGGNKPLSAIGTRLAGFALSRRRIGKAKLVGV